MAHQSTNAPTRKVTLGAAAGAFTTIVVWVLNTFDLLPNGTDIPGDIGAAMTTLLTFIVSYFIPPSSKDDVVQ